MFISVIGMYRCWWVDGVSQFNMRAFPLSHLKGRVIPARKRTHRALTLNRKKMSTPGIEFKYEVFWVVTGNYDAKVEYYRKEVERVANDFEQAKIDLNQRIDDTVEYVDTNVEDLTIYVNDEVRKNKDYVDG